MKSGLMMVDVQRAFARIYYDSLLTQVEKSSGVSQKLLFPEVLELSLEDKCLFTEIELELKAVGFEIAEFGKSMYRIEGVPAMISEGADVLRMLENIIGEIKVSGCEVSRKVHQIIANTISENASSLRVGRTMTADERNALLAQLFASSNPNYAPDGRKIVNTLSDDVIESMF
jgi:DNA mismatch repair protein MutL